MNKRGVCRAYPLSADACVLRILTLVVCGGNSFSSRMIGGGVRRARYDKFETYISIDINPSFEVIADGNDKVLAVNALNKDAVIVLYGKAGVYIGMSVSEVCADIVKQSVKLGYVNLNNTVDILAVNQNKSKEQSVLDAVKRS